MGVMKAGSTSEPGTLSMYESHASAGHAMLPGMRGRASTVGVLPLFIVFVDFITISRPSGLLVTSLLVSVWGPRHNMTEGARRLDERRNEKKPMHIAALTTGPLDALSRYSHAISRSVGVIAGAGEGT